MVDPNDSSKPAIPINTIYNYDGEDVYKRQNNIWPEGKQGWEVREAIQSAKEGDYVPAGSIEGLSLIHL